MIVESEHLRNRKPFNLIDTNVIKPDVHIFSVWYKRGYFKALTADLRLVEYTTPSYPDPISSTRRDWCFSAYCRARCFVSRFVDMTKIAVGVSYSSEVKLWLRVNGEVHRVAKIGPRRLMLRTPCEIAPGPAEITVCIDGREHTQQVLLPYGAVPFERFVEIECSERDLSSPGSGNVLSHSPDN
ncbi:MAG: hypothetical protein ACE5KM_19695 [Planctomycetaceae bacterium]